MSVSHYADISQRSIYRCQHDVIYSNAHLPDVETLKCSLMKRTCTAASPCRSCHRLGNSIEKKERRNTRDCFREIGKLHEISYQRYTFIQLHRIREESINLTDVYRLHGYRISSRIWSTIQRKDNRPKDRITRPVCGWFHYRMAYE